MKYSYTQKGFSLIELMIVIAIIACLSMIVAPNLLRSLAKAKRTEAYITLRSLAMAQRAYFAEHGRYTHNLSGPQGIGWKPEGNYNYTYGFSQGREGYSHFVGQLKTPAAALQGSHATTDSFLAYAAGAINGSEPDILSIDQEGVIKIVKDSLA